MIFVVNTFQHSCKVFFDGTASDHMIYSLFNFLPKRLVFIAPAASFHNKWDCSLC